MRGRALFSFILIFIISSLDAVSLAPTPYGARLKISSPSDTVYTDIYVDNGFIARLDGSESSYEITGLESDREYLLSIAYRDAYNSDLDAEFVYFETGNWDGEYLWKNMTDDDNKGRVRELRLSVKTVHDEKYGQYNEVYYDIDGTAYRIFPLFDFGQPVSWVDYDADTPQAICYRTNAEKFNKSGINPSRWRLTRMEVSPLNAVSHVETVAFGISIDCTIDFSFFLDDEGKKHVSFLFEGPSILRTFLFYSPNGESEDGAFILDEISSL